PSTLRQSKDTGAPTAAAATYGAWGRATRSRLSSSSRVGAPGGGVNPRRARRSLSFSAVMLVSPACQLAPCSAIADVMSFMLVSIADSCSLRVTVFELLLTFRMDVQNRGKPQRGSISCKRHGSCAVFLLLAECTPRPEKCQWRIHGARMLLDAFVSTHRRN